MSARTDLEAEQNQASTGITPETLTATLKQKLDALHVDIQDLSGTGVLTRCLHLVTNSIPRRVWSDVRGDHSVTTIREEDDTRATSISERYAQRRDSDHSCLESEVLHTGGVGKEEGWQLSGLACKTAD